MIDINAINQKIEELTQVINAARKERAALAKKKYVYDYYTKTKRKGKKGRKADESEAVKKYGLRYSQLSPEQLREYNKIKQQERRARIKKELKQ